MAKFRKKPQEVEAMQIFSDKLSDDGLRDFLKGCSGRMSVYPDRKGGIIFETDSYTVRAVDGDWLIKDSPDKFYVCKEDAFHSLYGECDAKACVAEREDSLEPLYDPFNSDSPVVLLEGKSRQWYVLKSAIAYVTPLDDPNTHSLVYMDGSVAPIYVKQCCSYFTFFGIPFKK